MIEWKTTTPSLVKREAIGPWILVLKVYEEGVSNWFWSIIATARMQTVATYQCIQFRGKADSQKDAKAGAETALTTIRLMIHVANNYDCEIK